MGDTPLNLQVTHTDTARTLPAWHEGPILYNCAHGPYNWPSRLEGRFPSGGRLRKCDGYISTRYRWQT